MTVPITMLRKRRAPWGDYGQVLLNGISSRRDGILHVDRVGPVMPPITFPRPAEIVVTDEFRGLLLDSGLTGLGFSPVQLGKVVRLDYSAWDTRAVMPRELPPGGEPVNYLADRPRDEAVAHRLGTLWELTPVKWGTTTVERVPNSPRRNSVKVQLASGPMPDVFRSGTLGSRLLSKRAEEWLSQMAGEYVTFVPVDEVVLPT
jgi:hypothetical protein